MRTSPCIDIADWWGSTFKEANGVVKIGRDADCSIKLVDEGISRKQCQYAVPVTW